MARVNISEMEYKEWAAAGLLPTGALPSNATDQQQMSGSAGFAVDANTAAEIRAKLKELKTQVAAQAKTEVKDQRRSAQSMLGGDFSAYSLLSSNKNGNTLLG